jgi:hypothetical protein
MYELLQPYFMIIAIVLAAILLLVLVVVIFNAFNGRVRGRKGSRLGITEFYEVDKDRRLVLVRRDDVEHLVMVGGESDFLIESNIPSAMMAQPEIPPPMEPQFRAPPRPAVFGSSRPPLRPVPSDYDPNDRNM